MGELGLNTSTQAEETTGPDSLTMYIYRPSGSAVNQPKSGVGSNLFVNFCYR